MPPALRNLIPVALRIVVLMVAASLARADDSMPSLAELEARGAVVGQVALDIGDVFDLSEPGEDKSLYRWANRIHITTRDSTIRSQLLFRPGDPLIAQRVEESERIVRANPFIYDAEIRVVAVRDNVVDFVVETRDNWTLFPELSLSRSGGETRWQFGLEEDNLLGTGSAVTISRRADDDRTSTEFFFSDRNLGRTWISLDLAYRDSDDGEAQRVRLAQPFYALDSRTSAGIDVFSDDREEPLFSRADEIGRFRQDQRHLEAWWGVSDGLVDDWVTRYRFGVVVDDNRFGPPEDEPPTPVFPENRDLRYPFVSIERIENRFEKVQNFNQIMQTEDLFLGRRFALTLGYAGKSFGGNRDALMLDASASGTRGDPSQDFLTLSGSFSGRVESGTLENGRLRVDARFYRRQSKRRTAFAGARVEIGRRLDVDNPVLLGGDNGLRGYDRGFGNGDASALFTVEQRFFTDWYPFRLFRVGGAIFADVGRTWGEDATGLADSRWLADVGFGLRLGSTRGNSNRVFHIDLAVPLRDDPNVDSGIQLLVQSKRGF